jgi:ribonuclease HI
VVVSLILPTTRRQGNALRIYAYCDGAVKGNGKAGRVGMGVVLNYYEGLEIVKTTTHSWGMNYDPVTNNLAELLAIRNTLHVINGCPEHIYLCIHSDSEWAVKAINGEYRISHHVDLVKEIRALGAEFDIFQVVWVRGHAGHEWNEKANELAQREAGTWKGK